jgi:hypothetical protein
MKGATRGLLDEWMEGNYLRLMLGLSRRQNELVGKFKMAVGDFVIFVLRYFPFHVVCFMLL